MHAAQKVGLYVPHFCYHEKLPIAANCRMCLVEVEKAPKALPACATPVTNGMVVHTCSEKARAAQKSVMEFLLINHPLDCPICDQGGECQLQDLAVGYGGSSSRYQEEKRVVFHKDVGPLVSAEEMSRCIHCTRCVRFGQEIAGVMELGMLGRGEHSEITTFVGRSIESELSGNMIDICPVGALTSKPFRYSARTWELARRRSVSPHDSLGANLVIQVKGDRVMRVVPFEDEAVNECWISDRDRFSYEGLNSEDRLSAPMIKGTDGKWQEASWPDALQAVAPRACPECATASAPARSARWRPSTPPPRNTRCWAAWSARWVPRTSTSACARPTPPSTLPDGRAVARHADRRTRQPGSRLVVGSFLRKDHPLMAQRLRQAAKRGTQILMVDSAADDPLMPVTARITVAPSELARALAEVAVALAQAKEQAVPAEFASVVPGDNAKAIAASLASGANTAVLMGNLAVASAQASTLAANGRAVAGLAGGKFGFLTSGGNTVGGYLAGAVPGKGGKNAAAMLRQSRSRPTWSLHAEAAAGCRQRPASHRRAARRAVRRGLDALPFGRGRVGRRHAAGVAVHRALGRHLVNAQGLAQSFKGTVAPFGQTRPAWKVLRVLGNVLHLAGFDDETSESVRDAVLAGGIEGRLSNDIKAPLGLGQAGTGLERVADVPIYRTDAMVRRSEPLQAAPASKKPAAAMNGRTLTSLGLTAGVKVRVSGGQGAVELVTVQDDAVADRAVRISAAFENTAALGGAFGQISVERA